MQATVKSITMRPLSFFFHFLFPGSVSYTSGIPDDMPAHPEPEKDVTLGAEYLDDMIRTDDAEDDMNQFFTR